MAQIDKVADGLHRISTVIEQNHEAPQSSIDW